MSHFHELTLYCVKYFLEQLLVVVSLADLIIGASQVPLELFLRHGIIRLRVILVMLIHV